MKNSLGKTLIYNLVSIIVIFIELVCFPISILYDIIEMVVDYLNDVRAVVGIWANIDELDIHP